MTVDRSTVAPRSAAEADAWQHHFLSQPVEGDYVRLEAIDDGL